MENDCRIVIDEFGITDYITKPYVGLIEWNDIIHVELRNIVKNKMLLIYVINPEKYLQRAPAMGLRNNYRLAGTPFIIPSSMLSMKLSDLEKIILRKIDQQKQKTNYYANQQKCTDTL